MKFVRRHRFSARSLAVLAVGLIGLGSLPPLSAEPQLGFYSGAGVGFASFSVETDVPCCYYYGPSGYDYGDEGTALSLNFGYRVNPYLAAEFGFFDASLEWQESLVFVPEFNDVFSNFVDADLSATQFTAVGILPFANVWEAYLKGGFVYSQGDAAQVLVRTSDGARFARSLDDSSTNFVFGVGIGVSPKPAWHLRFEFQAFGIDRDLIGASGSTTVDSMLFEFQYRPSGRRRPARDEIAVEAEVAD